MIWKKLLLEVGAVGGLGGGISGWINSPGGGIQVEKDKDSLFFNKNDSLKVKQTASKELKRNSGLVRELNHTALGVYRWQSEGVSEDILFVKGWDKAGPHKVIESKKHSQTERELWGGRELTYGNSWFGPRNTTLNLEEIEKVKETAKTSKKNYWTEIQESGKFITQEDLDELQRYWANRSKELEEDIFGLYHGRNWWVKKFEEKNGKVDLEFDFSKIKTILSKSEDELRDNPWSYGQLFRNPKLAIARLAGDVEGTAFNYLKKYLWTEAPTVKRLKEKNILPAIIALIAGSDETGFDCSSTEQEKYKSKFFKECLPEHIGKIRNGKVKKVLKATWKGNQDFWVPERGGKTSWHGYQGLKGQEEKDLLKMDEIKQTAFLNEKCELAYQWWSDFLDTAKEIRREVCDQIIRPWFGNIVHDKRLCLIEIEDFSYHLRLQTYLEVFPVPAWLNKNTFWTKCSNYGI
ncbi:hypothetical protein WEN_02975 [Mycoplasma wenyonii str. Massachusetts]|uniref:Uncharacterized protein n=1 Tax=Mycoplasma wenyonii (strain Massachusetts) TaxID=1197325 RepID=I6Z6Y7_MYCWM|nr:hypothetical protein [Mycoplasma wenyonii]AFN65378.1 hypothetical protein WEN_02975 [Mycoplasma wenyonii str. Massachusetts]